MKITARTITLSVTLLASTAVLTTTYMNCNRPTSGVGKVSSDVDISSYPHSSNFVDGSVHGPVYKNNPTVCQACHGADLTGGTANVSCVACHATHGSNPTTCIDCHLKDKPAASHTLVTADCAACHTYTTGAFAKLPGSTSDFSASGHADPTGPFSAHNSQNCARCHNLAGYKDYIGDDGSTEFLVDGTTFTAPGPLDCTACHNSKTQNYINNGVTLMSASGMPVTAGREGFCVACHLGRTGEGKLKVDAAIAGQDPNTKLTGTYTYPQWPGNSAVGGTLSAATNRAAAITPHYFPAAIVQYGHDAGVGYEYGGNYATKNPHVTGFNTCIGCHDPHTTIVKFNSCKTCHSNVNSLADLRNIRLHSTPDYDGDGDITEGVASELEGVKAKLLQAIQNYAAGAYVGVPIYYNADEGQKKFVTAPGGTTSYPGTNYTPLLLKATFNYALADHDPGAFAHNSRYIIELLYDSIKDLNDNGLDNGAHGNKVDMTNMYRPNP